MCGDYKYMVFTDESNWNKERYRSIAAVSIPCYLHNDRIVISQLKNILGIFGKEFKWFKLREKRYKEPIEKLIYFVLNLGNIRVDVLIWDTADSRHKVLRRDDGKNFNIMYYHLLKNLFTKKRIGESLVWEVILDEQGVIDKETLNSILKYGEKKLNLLPMGGVSNNKVYELHNIKIKDSKEELFIQVADFFAGIASFSWNNIGKYRIWENSNYGIRDLFEPKGVTKKFSKGEEIKFFALKTLYIALKERKYTVIINDSEGLRTKNPMDKINFWLYSPQTDKDKAPVRIKDRSSSSISKNFNSL